jgi:hypothetical protein
VDSDTLVIPSPTWRFRSAPLTASDPEWTPDDSAEACFQCGTPFTLFLRRHHCRICGAIYCKMCSTHSITPEYLHAPGSLPSAFVGQYHMMLLLPLLSTCPEIGRVCDRCFERALGMSIADFLAERDGRRTAQHELLFKTLSASSFHLPQLVKLVESTEHPFVTLHSATNDCLTPLHVAVKYRQLRAILVLVNHGHPLDPRERNRSMTPLHVAATHLSYAVVGLLLDLGADPNALTLDGKRPIDLTHEHSSEDPRWLLRAQSLHDLLLGRKRVYPRLPLSDAVVDQWVLQEDLNDEAIRNRLENT